MPVHHADNHQQPIYNIDSDMGDPLSPEPPQHSRQPPPRLHGDTPHEPAPAAREPCAEPAWMAAALAARGSGAEPARLSRSQHRTRCGPRVSLRPGAIRHGAGT